MTRVLGTPIVLERRRKKKKRRSDADHVERHLYRAAARTADAMGRGVRRYDRARQKSGDDRVLEVLPNMARGMSTAAVRMAPVPFDLLRAGWTPSVRRATRRTLRQLDR